MFVYSEIQNYQNEKSVKQILVFPSELIKDEFEKTFSQRCEEHGVERATAVNAGAIYMIRAVLNSDGLYIPCLRCGHTGLQIWEGDTHPNWKTALLEAQNYLIKEIVKSMPSALLSVLTDSHTSLVDGKIPPFTECFYKAKCEIAIGGACKHQGTEHNAPFSCASARAFEITKG